MEQKLSPSAFATLGFLAFGEASGYDLTRLARDAVGQFWTATDSQIYPALKQLEAAELVTSRREPGQRGSDRVVYAITSAGEGVLDDWLREPARVPALRHPAMIRLFFGWRLDRESLLALIERRRDQLRDLLAELDVQRQHLDELGASGPDTPAGELRFTSFVLDGGVELTRAELAWWDRAAGELIPE